MTGTTKCISSLAVCLLITGLLFEEHRLALLFSAFGVLFVAWLVDFVQGLGRHDAVESKEQPTMSIGHIDLASSVLFALDTWSGRRRISIPVPAGRYRVEVTPLSDGVKRVVGRIILTNTNRSAEKIEALSFSIPVDSGFIVLGDSKYVVEELREPEVKQQVLAMMDSKEVADDWFFLESPKGDRRIVFVPAGGNDIYEGAVQMNADNCAEVSIDCV